MTTRKVTGFSRPERYDIDQLTPLSKRVRCQRVGLDDSDSTDGSVALLGVDEGTLKRLQLKGRSWLDPRVWSLATK